MPHPENILTEWDKEPDLFSEDPNWNLCHSCLYYEEGGLMFAGPQFLILKLRKY